MDINPDTARIVAEAGCAGLGLAALWVARSVMKESFRLLSNHLTNFAATLERIATILDHIDRRGNGR